MTINVDAEGYVTGFEVGKRSYRELQHPPLSYSLAKSVLWCPEDAWRISQRRERVERETSDAMDDGNILDSLLTAPEMVTSASRLLAADLSTGQKSAAIQTWTAPTKKPTDPVEYLDWNGLRIILAESLQTKAAKEAAADARENDLTPVLAAKFEREVRKANEMLVRFELAGFDRSKYMYQVSLYWAETARNGRRIQCRGRLDFLSHDWTSIVDLKRVEDLSERSLQSAVDRYRWAMQAAAYSRAVVHLHAEGMLDHLLGGTGQAYSLSNAVSNVPTWEWLFARTSPVVACTLRPIDARLLQAGEAAWNRAVNEWAEGLQTGLWRGHESNHMPIEITAWAEEQRTIDLIGDPA